MALLEFVRVYVESLEIYLTKIALSIIFFSVVKFYRASISSIIVGAKRTQTHFFIGAFILYLQPIFPFLWGKKKGGGEEENLSCVRNIT